MLADDLLDPGALPDVLDVLAADPHRPLPLPFPTPIRARLTPGV